ncbi:MAG: NADH-quinone oxidoreductase subunit N [Krumholzibacteria bacterium]|nr:NADH-quinone oxidoreductase subunit N [Candidatus Krumholzibacteria bacterium]
MTHFEMPLDATSWSVLLPYLVIGGGGLLVMLVDAFVRTLKKDHLSYLTLCVFLASIVVQIAVHPGEGPRLGGMLLAGDWSRFFNYLFAGIGIMTTIFATGIYDRDGRYRPEFYPLLLFTVLGMMVLAAANDLLAVFLGLETMSLATYILAGGVRGNVRSSEAGFKYLVLGGFSSAFLLMGMALLYGYAGDTNFDAIARVLATGGGATILVTAGSALMLMGFGFKVAMVPFHMWTPDVYDGAPAYVTGFMATAVKAAGFAILLRVALLLQPQLAWAWYPVLTVFAVLTMSLGNLVALVQNNIKRMLAWSSIAHAGYLLLGVVTLLSPAVGDPARQALARTVGESAASAVLFYLVGYSLMNLAAFGVVNVLSNRGGEDADDINRYAGLSRRRPVAAATLAVALLSLAGIPPFVGFMAKFYLFAAVVKAGLVPLAVIGVINSLVSVYYYLRVIVVMYMKDTEADSYDGVEWVSVATAGALAALVLYLGIRPDAFHAAAASVIRQLPF